jgi:hypothetical protein
MDRVREGQRHYILLYFERGLEKLQIGNGKWQMAN